MLLVGNKQAMLEAGALQLRDAILVAFCQSSSALATFGESSVTIMSHSDHFFVFDSHARNCYGLVEPNGSSVFLEFSDLTALETYLYAVYADSVFNITPFNLRLTVECLSNENIREHDACISKDTAVLSMQDNSDSLSDHANSLALSEPVEKRTCREKSLVKTRNLENHQDIRVPENFIFEDTFLSNGRHLLEHSYFLSRDKTISFEHSYRARDGKNPKKGRSSKRHVNYNIPPEHTYGLQHGSSSLVDVENEQVYYDQSLNSNHTIGRNMEISDFSSIAETANTDSAMLLTAHTDNSYEMFIRKAPVHSCYCCDRFLFDNQLHKLIESKFSDLSRVMKISVGSDLCKTCCSYLRQSKMPMLCSQLNGLGIDSIPEELSGLSSLEKKLISKIQICMTMIILPGGQFAEKGLVLNLPRNVVPIVRDFSCLDNINNMCLIKFDARNAIGSHATFF